MMGSFETKREEEKEGGREEEKEGGREEEKEGGRDWNGRPSLPPRAPRRRKVSTLFMLLC